jgi:hypothetical protein
VGGLSWQDALYSSTAAEGFRILNEVAFNQVLVACDNDDSTKRPCITCSSQASAGQVGQSGMAYRSSVSAKPRRAGGRVSWMATLLLFPRLARSRREIATQLRIHLVDPTGLGVREGIRVRHIGFDIENRCAIQEVNTAKV